MCIENREGGGEGEPENPLENQGNLATKSPRRLNRRSREVNY